MECCVYRNDPMAASSKSMGRAASRCNIITCPRAGPDTTSLNTRSNSSCLLAIKEVSAIMMHGAKNARNHGCRTIFVGVEIVYSSTSSRLSAQTQTTIPSLNLLDYRLGHMCTKNMLFANIPETLTLHIISTPNYIYLVINDAITHEPKS